MILVLFFLTVAGLGRFASSYPEEGKWHYNISNTFSLSQPKSFFEGAEIYIDILCNAAEPDFRVSIMWQVKEVPCWVDRKMDFERFPESASGIIRDNKTVGRTVVQNCSGHITLQKLILEPPKIEEGKGPPLADPFPQKLSANAPATDDKKLEKIITSEKVKRAVSKPDNNKNNAVFTIPKDGFYYLIFTIKPENQLPNSNFTAEIQIQMKSDYGFLSAADYPFLPFYGVMCLVYIVYGAVWLTVSFCQWRDLLRIQFWIGGVILLGMLEKATFYAEYLSINNTGEVVKGAVLLAEWVSCGKRTLARMLVIIVSLGFGIVKPRLGPMLHRVVGVGACYFTLAVVESYIRVMHPKNDPSNQLLVAGIPLAVLDSGICWWIFTSLVQTTRTLRLRRNLVKLNLYRHFTNTLIFAVLASVIFMLYSIKAHKLAMCITDWKEIWVDEAYWHVLFSVLLLVIMILWRPTNNNQRYAFTPLLDAADDDEEEDQFVNDAYVGVKMRTHSRASSPKPKPSSDDDILKWVDENIPSAGVETALPILDSEEEILTTKFEVSKMQ